MEEEIWKLETVSLILKQGGFIKVEVKTTENEKFSWKWAFKIKEQALRSLFIDKVHQHFRLRRIFIV